MSAYSSRSLSQRHCIKFCFTCIINSNRRIPKRRIYPNATTKGTFKAQGRLVTGSRFHICLTLCSLEGLPFGLFSLPSKYVPTVYKDFLRLDSDHGPALYHDQVIQSHLLKMPFSPLLLFPPQNSSTPSSSKAITPPPSVYFC